MPRITSNFKYTSEAPNFERDAYETLEDMEKVEHLDPGHIVYCYETGEHYQYLGKTETGEIGHFDPYPPKMNNSDIDEIWGESVDEIGEPHEDLEDNQ